MYLQNSLDGKTRGNIAHLQKTQRYLHISRRTLLRWVRGHKIPTIRATRRLLLFKRTDLDAAMERLTIEAI